MKTLLLLRHAKSSWSDPFLADKDRPLKRRAKKDALRMGREIALRGLLPDLLLTSTAKRARQTAKRFARGVGYLADWERDKRLYFAGVEGLLEVLSEVEGDPSRVLVVGHNPDLEELVTKLTGDRIEMATATLARVDLDLEKWSQIPQARGRLALLLGPSDLETD